MEKPDLGIVSEKAHDLIDFFEGRYQSGDRSVEFLSAYQAFALLGAFVAGMNTDERLRQRIDKLARGA